MSKLTENYQGEKVKELTKTYQEGEMKKSHKIVQAGKEPILKPENAIVVIDIPIETIDTVASIGDSVPRYAKIVEKGFEVNDETRSEIIGRIVKMKVFGAKWVEKNLDKIPFVSGTDLPDGYAPRCDLDVEAGGEVIRISLPTSSLKYKLSPYIRSLKNNGMRPDDIITRLRVIQATNKFGPFNVVIFDIVDKVAEPIPITPPPIVSDPQVSASPQPYGSGNVQKADTSNPWA